MLKHLPTSGVPLRGLRLVRPLPEPMKFHFGVVINDARHLNMDSICDGDIAICQAGRPAPPEGLVVTQNAQGFKVQKKIDACRCRVLGAVVRIERDVVGWLVLMSCTALI